MVSIVTYGVPGEVGYRKELEAKDLTPSEIHYYIGTHWCGYSALLMSIIGGKVLIRCGEGLDSHNIDRALNQLSLNQRVALCAYYGLMGYECKDLSGALFAVQRANSHNKGDEVWSIKTLIAEGEKALHENPLIRRLISLYTDGQFFPEK